MTSIVTASAAGESSDTIPFRHWSIARRFVERPIRMVTNLRGQSHELHTLLAMS